MTVVRSGSIARTTKSFTTTSGGDASGSFGACYGRLAAVAYDAGDVATGADITITDASGAAIITLTNAGTSDRYFRPTTNVTDNVGVAITPATTAADVNRDIVLAGNIGFVVAQGGNAKSGAISLITENGSLS